MKFQGYKLVSLMVFSASIFFILLLFPLQYHSFLNSTYNSYSVLITLVDKLPGTSDPHSNIHNSSTTTIVTSLTSKSNASEVVVKDNNNATAIEILNPVLKINENPTNNSTTSTITTASTKSKSRHNVSQDAKNSHNRTNAPVKRDISMKIQLRRLVRGKKGLSELESTGISCDSSDFRLDLCVISQPIVLEKQKNSLNIYTQSWKNAPSNRVVRPYPKKEDSNTMNMVTPVNILKGNFKLPHCEVKHSVPALVFSFGGFTDNNFHKFSEVLIPLFVTSRHFDSRVQFVVTDNKLGEIWKFSKILKSLSPYEVIDTNVEDDNRVHCFPSAIVGLRYFDNLKLNKTDTPGRYSMTSFKALLRESYNLKVVSTLKPERPKVLLLSRPKSRSFLNEDKIVALMKKLGFRVRTVKPDETSDLDKLSKIVNSCDMMIGVHGAGLTNEVFLPDGAVVVQIVPLGLEWASEHYFGLPTPSMGLKYSEYKIDPNESSLYDLYGPNDPIVCDTASIWAKGFGVVKEMYIDRQQIRVNLTRFESTLVEAMELLRKLPV